LELRDLLIALNIQGPLSLPQLFRNFGIEPHDDERLKKLKFSLSLACKNGLDSRHKKLLCDELRAIEKGLIKIVTIFDKDYPENLKNIFDPPCVIYVNGNLIKSDLYSIAIVGSRRASFAGINFAKNLGFSLSSYNITVVSGLAVCCFRQWVWAPVSG